MLVKAGHAVTGTKRTLNKAESIRLAGAKPEVADALSRKEVLEAVQRAEPDVIIHQLTTISYTALPHFHGGTIESEKCRNQTPPALRARSETLDSEWGFVLASPSTRPQGDPFRSCGFSALLIGI